MVKHISEKELVEKFWEMADFKLPPETVQRDLADIRRQLNNQRYTKSQKPQGISNVYIGRIIMKSGITKIAATAVLIVGILIGINQFGGAAGSIAFGQVIEHIRSLDYSFDLTVEPITMSSEDTPINSKALVLASNKLQLNWKDKEVGNVSVVVDYVAHKAIQLFHNNKLGRILSYDGKAQNDLSLIYAKPVETLWGLKDEAAEIGEKIIDGRKVVGFEILQDDSKITIWVDIDNGFPFYATAVVKPTDNSVTARWSMKNFNYDIEAEKVFSIEGPDDYTIVNTSGTVLRHANISSEKRSAQEAKTGNVNINKQLLIKPLEGIGNIKFGMSREQVIKELGQPDQFLGKNCLDFSSTLGLSLLIHPKRGLLAYDCWSLSEKSSEGLLCGAEFVGKTTEDIGINSTRNDVIREYGDEFKEYLIRQPDIFALQYPKLNMVIELRNDKVIHISINAPR